METESLKQRYEQAVYQELYQMNREGQALVIDEVTQELFVRKRRKIFHPEVYAYLQEHPHPNLPVIRRFWTEGGTLNVIEEYIQGKTLNEVLQEKTFSDQEKAEILSGVMDAVMHLHNAKPPIIHRDIKMNNIMIAKDGTAKLIDYDSAKPVRPDEETDTVLMGTHGYAAPEQYGFRQSDERTDIYALGVLIGKLFPDYSGMQKIAERATKMDPDQRYQTVRELKRQVFAGRGVRPVYSDGQTGKRQKLIRGRIVTRNRTLHKTGGYLFRLPGFRTRTPWKVVLALIGYPAIFYLAITLRVDGAHGVFDLWLNRITFLLIETGLLGLYTGWPVPASKMLMVKSSRLWIKITGYCIYTLAVVILPVFFMVIIQQAVYY